MTADNAHNVCRGPLVVQLLDLAAQANELFGDDGAAELADQPRPDHDWRFRLATPAGRVTFDAGATADIATRMDWE